MSATFRILPRYGLVYVRYEGTVLVSDTQQAFGAYMTHPDFRPGQKHLVDLTATTGYEKDYFKVMELQAMKASKLMVNPAQTMIAYLAPTRLSYEMARMAANSWDDVSNVVATVQQDEAAVLAVLGFTQSRIAELLGDADASEGPLSSGH